MAETTKKDPAEPTIEQAGAAVVQTPVVEERPPLKELSAVKYIGGSNSYIMEPSDMERYGNSGHTENVVWNAGNDFTVSPTVFNAAFIDHLNSRDDFSIE